MKTISFLIISTLVLFSIAAAPAPENMAKEKNVKAFDGFQSLRTHRHGRGAEVSWSFISSNVAGFTVQRTNEDPSDPYSVWVNVSTMGYDASRSYKCDDENPFPGLINYRVIATMTDQSTITSQISTVRIVAH
jgi:hypothetical protein